MLSAPFTRQFFIRGKYYGEGGLRFEKEQQHPASYAYFCPFCAEIWARCPVIFAATGKAERFHPLIHRCEKCKPETFDIFLPPGSLTLSYDPSVLDSMPPEALRRELLLLLNFYHPEEQNDRND